MKQEANSEATMNIQWYPGHMTKTRRMIEADVKLVDAVCEILDARIPLASRNPDIDAICAGKPRLIVLNRADQADLQRTEGWKDYFKKQGFPVIALDSQNGGGYGEFLPLVRQVMAQQIARNEEKGLKGKSIRIMACGIPNVGKSSLLNSLAGYERAIVTDEAGTTRDVVTESVRCGDTVLRLSDTAGLRETSSQAEKMGIDKARESARESRLVLCVFDGSSPLTEEDRQVMETAQGLERAAILNKWDKGALDFPEMEQAFPKVFRLSAKTGEGVSELCQWLAGMTQGEGETLVTSARQAALLGKAAESCRMAAQSAAMGFTADAFLADGEEAVRLLDEVLGDAVSEDIVHGIFSRFCVGK